MDRSDRAPLDDLTLQDLLRRLRRLERRRAREPRFSPAWLRADGELVEVARQIFHHPPEVPRRRLRSGR